MIERICQIRKRDDENGLTLIELLVVIIILGILSAVVVFAVRGTGDKGQDAAIRVAALKTKQVDAGGIGSEESVTDAALAPVSNLPRVSNFGGWNRALHFNLSKGFPYNNASFRQAVAYTVDRKDLLQRIVGGRGQVSSMGTLSPSHAYAAPGLPPYDRDVARSKQLLDSIGLTDTDANGKRNLPGGPDFIPTLYTSSRFSLDAVTVVQQYLRDVGVESTVVSEASGTSDARATQGNYEMMFVGWGNVTADPDQLRTRFSGRVVAPGQSFTNIYGWNSTEFMDLADQQFVEPNQALRKQQVQRMQQLIAQDVPMIPLYVPQAMIMYQPGGFSAWYSTPGGTPPGPPGFSNKHVFVTGKQFGLPAGYQ